MDEQLDGSAGAGPVPGSPAWWAAPGEQAPAAPAPVEPAGPPAWWAAPGEQAPAQPASFHPAPAGDDRAAPLFYGQRPPAGPYGSGPPYGWVPRHPGTPPSGGPPSGTPASGGSRRRGGRQALLGLLGVVVLAGGLGAGLEVLLNNSNAPSPAASGVTGGSRSGASGANGGLGSGAAGSTGGGSTPATPAGGASPAVISRVKDALDPAVVDIDVNVATAGPAAGTGMILTSSGYVLTNNHVIDNTTSVEVTIAGRTGAYPADVVGYDATDDVAVIKIRGVSGLPTVQLGDSSSTTVGQSVIALGNALGQGGPPTVVSGAITALGRTITAGDAATSTNETLHDMLQTDADIQQGDSGGPLVTTSGKVIGMDTAAYSADTGATIGFAIPINRAASIARQIMKGKGGNGVSIGLAPFLGVFIGSASVGNGGGSVFGASGPTGPAVAGVLVQGTTPGGPAERAGLVSGDTITAIDGKSTKTFAALHGTVAAHRPGQRLSVTYVDPTGASHTVQVTLGGIPY